jgi:hypothetical protein
MRTMWLIVDDPDGFDPVGWDADPIVTVHDYTYEPLDADVEVYGEAPDGYTGRHRGEIEDADVDDPRAWA